MLDTLPFEPGANSLRPYLQEDALPELLHCWQPVRSFRQRGTVNCETDIFEHLLGECCRRFETGKSVKTCDRTQAMNGHYGLEHHLLIACRTLGDIRNIQRFGKEWLVANIGSNDRLADAQNVELGDLRILNRLTADGFSQLQNPSIYVLVAVPADRCADLRHVLE